MARNLPFIPNLTDVRVHTRGYIPHWEMPDAVYFITYRLHDSLPQHVVHALEDERRAWKRMYGDGATALDRAKIRLMFEHSLDRALDTGYGAAHLADHRIARIVVENLKHFDGVRYETIAWCVMPTHVHVVIRALGAQKLAAIVQSWKSYTAKRANEILGRQGTFWSREYFDRIVRSADDLSRTVEYVINNPAKSRPDQLALGRVTKGAPAGAPAAYRLRSWTCSSVRPKMGGVGISRRPQYM